MKSIFVTAAMLVAAPVALAQVAVSDAWIRGTVAHQTATGAFMQLVAERDGRLVEANSPAAAQVEIHEMRMENDVMRMRRIDALPLPAGKQVVLQPGGFHLMLTGLKAPLREGDKVPLSLVFQADGQAPQTVRLDVPVRALHGKGGLGHGR